MSIRRRLLAASLVLLPVLGLATWLFAPTGSTRLELSDAGIGRRIAAFLLPEGQAVVLTWKNSLFGLAVTEVFVARGGILTLSEITFADPAGREPPRVKPAEVDELYHTGGPFRAEGLSRPFSRIVFRVGEIGNPVITIGSRVVRLAQEVGFGGAVLLIARSPSLSERLVGLLSLRDPNP